jgi:hypothetical protein
MYIPITYKGRPSAYLHKENKFKNTFLRDGGHRLMKLISNSCNVDTPWEFPRGRKDPLGDESDMETAIREFTEETLIDNTKYKMLWHMKPYIETYTDFNVTYQNIYYYAEAIGIWEPELKFYNKQQIGEVSAIKWISKPDLIHIKLEDTTYKRLLKSFDKIIKKYRNGNKVHIRLDRCSVKLKDKLENKLEKKIEESKVVDNKLDNI